MKAIILAAGRGSRMQDLTNETPKGLVKFRGKPLLYWQLDSLYAANIDEIAIVTGYRCDQFAGLRLVEFHNPRWSETNMVSSLACASEWLTTEPCVVSYSDIFYEPDAVTALINLSADLAITYDENWRALWQRRFGNPLFDAETFRLDKNTSTLMEIGNRPKSAEDIEGQFMGLLRFTPAGWGEVVRIRETLPSKESDLLDMTATLQRVIEAGRVPVSATPFRGIWGEIDSEHDLGVYEELLKCMPTLWY